MIRLWKHNNVLEPGLLGLTRAIDFVEVRFQHYSTLNDFGQDVVDLCAWPIYRERPGIPRETHLIKVEYQVKLAYILKRTIE